MGNSAAAGRFPRPRSATLLRLASDERLVELVRAGNETAFEAIYDRHHRAILAFCRHMLSSPEEGEDAVQHTFMAAYRHLVAGDAAIQLRPWLFAIARNRCLSLLRSRRERPLDELHEPATDHLSAEAQRRLDVRELLADVAALPDDQRAALVLAEIGAVSHEEIAQVLEVPRQKVKALVFQARTSLAASRKARETPCAEIREQLANLRGGALRRTTLHRHLRECAGCRAFREEVALQRKTMALALPVVPTLGLKEAALGAAFGSAGAGGGAAAAGGAAVVAKVLVAVALVGGGATAGVEAVREAAPPLPAKPATGAGGVRGATTESAPSVVEPRARPTAAATVPARRERARSKPARERRGAHAKSPAAVTVPPAQAQRRPARPAPPGQAHKPDAAEKPKRPKQSKPKPAPGKPKPKKPAKATPPGHAKLKPTPPGRVKAHAAPPGQAKPKPPVPGQTKPHASPPGQAAPKPPVPGQTKPHASPPGQAAPKPFSRGQTKPRLKSPIEPKLAPRRGGFARAFAPLR